MNPGGLVPGVVPVRLELDECVVRRGSTACARTDVAHLQVCWRRQQMADPDAPPIELRSRCLEPDCGWTISTTTVRDAQDAIRIHRKHHTFLGHWQAPRFRVDVFVDGQLVAATPDLSDVS
jgi:hypothetical protein